MNKKLQADNAALRAEKQVKKLNSYRPRERKRKILKISTAHVRSLWKMMELFFSCFCSGGDEGSAENTSSAVDSDTDVKES